MVRRFLALAFAVALATLIMANTGCENLRQSIRSSASEHPEGAGRSAAKATNGGEPVESDPTKIWAVDADAKNPQPFFKNNRRSGGWSSEAREIESHLGVGP